MLCPKCRSPRVETERRPDGDNVCGSCGNRWKNTPDPLANAVMDFASALIKLREGKRIARAGWNGKGMFLFLVPGSNITVSEGRPLASVFPVRTEIGYRPHIDMKTAQGDVVPWVASQSDLLADDWFIVQ